MNFVDRRLTHNENQLTSLLQNDVGCAVNQIVSQSMCDRRQRALISEVSQSAFVAISFTPWLWPGANATTQNWEPFLTVSCAPQTVKTVKGIKGQLYHRAKAA